MHRQIYTYVFFIIVVLIYSINPAYGQSGSTTGVIKGIVLDEQNASVASATIMLRNKLTNEIREVLTDEKGTYSLLLLPPGDYEVKIIADGFSTQLETANVSLGNSIKIESILKLSETSDSILVRGHRAYFEDRTEGSTNISQTEIENLPINRRDFLDFSLLSPGVTPDRIPLQGIAATTGLSVHGLSARFNNITIDGFSNTDLATGAVRASFSQDAVQEFQIITDSYSAEFGRALGAVINIISKGGSNEYHGGLFFLNRNNNTSARNAFSPINPKFQQYQFGATVSGPIRLNKEFFFLSFERQSTKQNNIITISDQSVQSAKNQGFNLRNGAVPLGIGNSIFTARADFEVSARDKLNVKYNGNFNYNGAFEPFGDLIGETNAAVRKFASNSISVNNIYLKPQSNLTNETRFIYNRRNQSVLPVDIGPNILLLAPEGRITFGRNIQAPNPRIENNFQYVNNTGITKHSHQIKFGVDYASNGLVSDLPFYTSGQGIFAPINFGTNSPTFSGLEAFDPKLRTPQQRLFLQNLAAQFAGSLPGFPKNLSLENLPIPISYIQGFGNTESVTTEKFFSAFIQDEYRVKPNLVVKVGIRYDNFRIKFTPNNKGNFSPRIAFSYRPANLPNLHFHSSYGIFVGTPLYGAIVAAEIFTERTKVLVVPFPLSVIPFSLPGRTFPQSFNLPKEVEFIPQLSTIVPIQKDFRNSYTQQISTGLDYLLVNKFIFSLNYKFTRGVKLFGSRNINPVVRPIPGDPLKSLLVGRVDPTSGDILQFENSFDSYYNGVSFSFASQLDDHFKILSHYTFSKTIDNTVDYSVFAQELQNPLLPRGERGLSLQDVRHRFVTNGIWTVNSKKSRLLNNLQISGIITLETGRPYNLVTGVDLDMNGDNGFADRPLGLGRNAGVTPGFANLDFRVKRSFIFKDKVNLQFTVECFNVLNRVNIKDINRVFSPDIQGRFNLPAKENGRFIVTQDRYTSAFSPRQIQVGFRLEF